MNKEIRTFTLQDIEVREAVDGTAPEIRGYAAVFGAESLDLGGFQEVIERGAFSRTLAASPDVRAVVEHTGGLTTIGRTRNGTLELREDETGLAVRIVPPPTSAGRDAYALVQRGDMDQMSFAFWVVDEAWETREGRVPLRRLRDVELDGGDVSLVSYPAYPQTSAEARARAAATASQEASGGEDGNDGGGDAAGEPRPEDRLDVKRRRIELLKLKYEVQDE